MRQSNQEINYYEVLGFSSAVSLDEIKKAYRTLMGVFHTDKWKKDKIYFPASVYHTDEWKKDKTYHSGGEAKEFEQVKAYAILLNEANDYFFPPPERELEFPKPVPETHRRKNISAAAEPKDESEFLAWLDEDIKKYPENISFQRAKQATPETKTNIWKLIQATLLSYENFESEEIDLPLLWQTVLEDEAVTEYVCEKWHRDPVRRLPFADAKAVPALLAHIQGYEIRTSNHRDSEFNDLESAWQRVHQCTEPLNHANRYLLDVLSTLDRNFTCVFLEPLVSFNENTYTKLYDHTRARMVDLIYEYRRKTKSLNDLRLQLVYLSHLVFVDHTGVLEMINKKIIQPIEVKIEKLNKKPKNQISKIKVDQLNIVLNEIHQTIINGITSWVKENEDHPETNFEEGHLKETHTLKTRQLYKDCIGVIKKHENAKAIGKNANKIGAFLRWLRCAAETILTVGVALASQGVRDGLFWTPKTKAVLRSCRKEFLREEKKWKKEEPTKTPGCSR